MVVLPWAPARRLASLLPTREGALGPVWAMSTRNSRPSFRRMRTMAASNKSLHRVRRDEVCSGESTECKCARAPVSASVRRPDSDILTRLTRSNGTASGSTRYR
jgi:hypothetical protein